jgi:hypothetical protein
MRGRTGGAIAAAGLLAAGLAASGCCGLARARAVGNRDTPEAAFEYVRSAFEEDRTGDQVDSLHWDFKGRQGISDGKYVLARNLRPGLFEKAARILGAAKLEKVEYARLDTRRRPGDAARLRDAARVSLATAEGSGVFILVDEPTWRFVAVEKDGRVVTQSGQVDDLGRFVRVREGRIEVDLRRPVDFPMEEAPRVLRFEVFHDWLLFDVESLQGFEEFLGQVKETADRTEEAPAGQPAEKEEAPK